MSAQNEGFHDDVESMVGGALRKLETPYGLDVIEDVFVKIEEVPNLMRNYQQLCVNHDVATVNRAVGKLTRALTGYDIGKQVKTTRTKLAQSYTILIPRR